MKAKSKKLLVLIATFVIMFNFSSCKKYPDGPAFSLRSKTARLTGTWKIVDGIDDSEGVDVYYVFKKNNDFEFKYTFNGQEYTVSGDWSWGDGKETVIIDPDDFEKVELTILRLTNSEFWFKDEDNDEYKAEKE